MTRPRLWVEPCAGSAAVALRLVGGPYANPPIGYMGGKRGYARAILGALGLRQGLGADEVWLADAGPWGPVWRVLTTPGMAAEVARVIRGWEGEEPRALWERLKARGWGELTEAGEVAGWATVAAWAHEAGNTRCGFGTQPEGRQLERIGATALASRVEAVARWLTTGAWCYRPGDHASGGPVLPGERRADTTATATATAGCALTACPCQVWPDAASIPIPDDCRGVFVYLDPPYEGCTGYTANLPRADVLDIARRWSDAGAVVCVSEAVPLDLVGWCHVEVTGERVGQKRTFSKQQAEWLTMNREPAWRPSVQEPLFGEGAR